MLEILGINGISSLLNIPAGAAVLFDIAIIIIIAAIFAFIARLFKQPLIPAYILAGILVGPLVLGLIKDITIIRPLAEIGIAFLLFIAGLEITTRRLRDVFKVVTITGIVQVTIVATFAFFVFFLLGFYRIESIYIALAVAFSSTIIIVKLLTDKREINTLHGRIIIGILLVQDIIAIFALMILTSGVFSFTPIVISILKGLLLMAIAILLTKTILTPIFRFAAKSSELLFVSAIAFCFLFALAAYLLGFSIIIGAFIAGVALANSPFKVEMGGKMMPLRDFFTIIFFVAIGTQFILLDFTPRLIITLIALVLILFIVEPIVTMLSVRFCGYKKRTSFLSGITMVQTSEFSLILITQGLILGHVAQETFSMIILLTIVTMSLTPYILKHGYAFYPKFSPFLKFFGKLSHHREKLEYISRKQKSIVLFGCHRMGTIFLESFSKEKDKILVIDFNPEIIKSLMKQRISCIYGDIANPEVLSKVNLKEVKLVVSTIPEKEDNLPLIKQVKETNPSAIVFVTADHIHDALELYKTGADYVILPQVLGGEKGISLLRRITQEKRRSLKMKKMKKKHIKYLEGLHSFLY